MSALPISYVRPPLKKRFNFLKDSALSFLDSIDSSWKGHEQFAIWLVKRLGPQTIVDLGLEKGFSTIAFAYRNRGHVYGIDWFEEGGSYVAKSIALENVFRNVTDAIRFKYAKNIHLIIGPFSDISKTWKRSVDILHIDGTKSYEKTKTHHDNWKRYLSEGGVILVHDVMANPEGAGKFFNELDCSKCIFPHSGGLGVASSDEMLIEDIKASFHI